MLVFDPDEMQKIDRYTISELMISEKSLMENAALAVFNEVIRSEGHSVSIIVGKGNNGADAMLVAKQLISSYHSVKIFLMFSPDEMKSTPKIILDSLRAANADIYEYSKNSKIEADIIIDGLFGTGFRGSIDPLHKYLIDRINRSGAKVISVDIPSGLNGKTGEISDVCIRADVTVTFGGAKTGFFQAGAKEVLGKLIVKNIGSPKEAFDVVDHRKYYVDNEMIKDFFPARSKDSNKGNFGKALIIAGSKDMPGAGILTAKAAYRTGAGYVYINADDENRMIYSIGMPEVLHMNKQDYSMFDSIAIGPGLGAKEETIDVIKSLLGCDQTNVVLDADALNSIKDANILKNTKANVAVTPHPKEFSRLSGLSVEHIQKNRIEVCRDFAIDQKVLTILKGANTVIADKEGNVYINSTGNDSLAKAGSGDVLTGMIAGFSAYMDLLNAALLAVYLHGYCADLYVKEKSRFSLTASEIIEYLPKAILECGLV